MDLNTLIAIIGALITEAPGIIEAWTRGDEDAETQLRNWLEARDDVQAASDRWKRSRTPA